MPSKVFNQRNQAVRAATVIILLVISFDFASGAVFAKHYSPELIDRLQSAEHFISLEDYQAAKTQILLALKEDPQCTDALNNLGVIYLRLHQFEKAKIYFEQALQINPHLPTSLSNLAQVYYFLGNYDLAVSTYKQALPYITSNQCLPLSNLADALTAQGNYQQASLYYKEALKINQSFPQALLGSAILCFRTGSYDLARQYALKALKQKPDWALAYYQLGEIEAATSQNRQALKAYLLSLNYEKNHKYAEETEKLISALGIDPLSIARQELVDYQAECLHTNPVFKANLAEKASTPYPHHDKQTGFERAQNYLAKQQWQRAQHELEVLLMAKSAGDPVLLNDLGLAHAGQNDYAAAEGFYQKAIKLSQGKCIPAYYNLGQLYRQQQDLLAAKDTFQKAINQAAQQHKSYPLANNALALTLKQLGDNEGALAAYRVAVSEAGVDFPVFHFNYAILLEKTDHARQAINEYRLYLKLAPQGHNVQQAQARLRRLGVDS